LLITLNTLITLNIFSSIFNWVLDKILSPVFNFLAGLLGSLFEVIFNEVLAPIVKFAFETAFPFIWDIFIGIFSGVLYSILATILGLVDTVQAGFDVLIGLQPVTYSSAAGTVTDKSLLEVLFTQSAVGNIFLRISIAAVILAFLAAIYGVVRSALDFDMENKRPIGQVMRSFFKAAVTFLMVPLLALFMIQLSGTVLRVFSTALGETGGTLGRTIFLVATLDAGNDGNTNPSFTDSLRAPYWNGAKKFTDQEVVETNFDLEKIDFITGFAAAIFALIIMVMCIVIFVQRIFEVLMLYIVSPFFVATMPLDDGERFGKWRDLFIAKLFSGFGAAIGMRLYLMILPDIMDNGFTFFATASKMDYVIKMLFVLGGAWTIYKSSSMLTTLLNFQAGQSETQTGQAAAMGAIGAASYAGGVAGRGVLAVGRGIKRGVKWAVGSDDDDDDSKDGKGKGGGKGDHRDQQRFGG
jgi:hypothetical protein